MRWRTPSLKVLTMASQAFVFIVPKIQRDAKQIASPRVHHLPTVTDRLYFGRLIYPTSHQSVLLASRCVDDDDQLDSSTSPLSRPF